MLSASSTTVRDKCSLETRHCCRGCSILLTSDSRTWVSGPLGYITGSNERSDTQAGEQRPRRRNHAVRWQSGEEYTQSSLTGTILYVELAGGKILDQVQMDHLNCSEAEVDISLVHMAELYIYVNAISLRGPICQVRRSAGEALAKSSNSADSPSVEKLKTTWKRTRGSRDLNIARIAPEKDTGRVWITVT